MCNHFCLELQPYGSIIMCICIYLFIYLFIYVFIYLFMVALCNRETIYIFILFLLLSFFFLFFSSPNLSSRRLDVYHTLAHGVVLV